MTQTSLYLKGGGVMCKFTKDLHIIKLTDLKSGEKYFCQRTFEPSIATVKIDDEWESLRPSKKNYEKSSLAASFASKNAQARFKAWASEKGILFSFQCFTANEKLIQNFAWNLGVNPSGLSFLFPSRAGTKLDEDMPLGESMQFAYPFPSLNAQFCLIEGEKSVVRIASFEESSPFYKIIVSRERPDLLTFKFGVEPKAPFQQTYQSPVFYISTFSTWKEAVKDYKKWMEKKFKPKKLAERPEWLSDLKLVVMIVTGKTVYDPGIELHNYDDLINLVDLLVKCNAPKTTLIYVMGALLPSYDGYLPEYWPREEQGGEEKFSKFLDYAHSKGFKIMLEINPFGIDYNHPLWEKVKNYRVSDAYGNPNSQGYRDHATPSGREIVDFFGYVSPCCKEWEKFITERCKRIVKRWSADLFLLDQSHLYFNDPNCDFDKALPKLYKAIAEACSPALLAGEGCHERMISTDIVFSVVNCELYSSVLRPSWVKVHLIDMELFRDYIVFSGHEGTLPSPGHRHVSGWPSMWRIDSMGWTFEDQQTRHRYLRVVPTVRITPRYGEIDEDTICIIEEARNFKY